MGGACGRRHPLSLDRSVGRHCLGGAAARDVRDARRRPASRRHSRTQRRRGRRHPTASFLSAFGCPLETSAPRGDSKRLAGHRYVPVNRESLGQRRRGRIQGKERGIRIEKEEQTVRRWRSLKDVGLFDVRRTSSRALPRRGSSPRSKHAPSRLVNARIRSSKKIAREKGGIACLNPSLVTLSTARPNACRDRASPRSSCAHPPSLFLSACR